MDSFRESMDSYRIVTANPDSKKVRFVPYNMNPANPGFVSYRGSRILTLKDSLRIVSHESSQFSKICLFLWILSTIAQNESLKIEIRESETLKIRIVDLICRSVFERFVSWIRFMKTKISNYSIHFDS